MDDIAIVGDIHGCIDDLHQILDLVAGRARELIFVGDYVNRGRESAEVLQALVDLKNSGLRPTFLAGNHDLAFLSCLHGTGLDHFLQIGGAATIRSYITHVGPEVLAQLASAVPTSHVGFLENLRSHYSNNDLLVTHAPEEASLWVTPDTPTRYLVAGHIPQPTLVPLVTDSGALIDTGCGTWKSGRLTSFLWPSRTWVQSRQRAR